ncbi:MAG: NmrA family NAD(P)-binding protein [Kofleriaceae bacterium]|nr:NmrA family NAD(P)-binding protein [Kofleriaceae bacterium]
MNVLVVGATGHLGLKITRELIAAGAQVRVTHRASSKPEQIAQLRETGAELVIADLADSASLVRACSGVAVVVSAVQGMRDVIVDGQTRLLRAAEQARVSRMIPSDYALDFFKTPDGGNRNLDLRRELNRAFDGSSVRPTSVLCGAFMDLLALGAMGPDPKTHVYRVYGDPDQPYDFTLTDDVAKYIAAAALDTQAPRMLRVAGDTKSPRELAAVFEEIWKVPVTLEVAGSVADLDAQIERMRAADEAPANPFPLWQRMQYARDMASGRGLLTPLDNARYSHIQPTTIRDLLARPR